MAAKRPAYGVADDPRFTLHHRQPRANKLDARQRLLCMADPTYAEALGKRVAHPNRFAAFMDRAAYYIDVEKPCPKCGGFKRRTRDRSCYVCHLRRSGENFERMKAGLAPHVQRSRDSHLDLLQRRKAEKQDEFVERRFGEFVAKSWPTGKLEITFPDGYLEPDFSKLSWQECMNALEMYPGLRDVLRWASWSVD